jgi:hypothetical protein
MAFFNVKFRINTSPGIATLHHLKFGGKAASNAQLNAKKGIVKDCSAINCLLIDCLASGNSSSSLTIDVELTRLEERFDKDHKRIVQPLNVTCRLTTPVRGNEENGRIRIVHCFPIACP